MFGIKINNEFLDMPETFSMLFTIRSPIFEADAIEGDFSHEFTIPLTSRNNNILNCPGVIENLEPILANQPCELYFNGQMWRKALLNVSSVTTIDITVTVFSNSASFLNSTGPKKLSDIDYDVPDLIPEAYRYALWLIAAVPGGSDTITVDIDSGSYTYNKNFTGNLMPVLDELVAAINAQTGSHSFTATAKALPFHTNTGKQMAFLHLAKPFSFTADSTPLAIYFAATDCELYQPEINHSTLFPAAVFDHIQAHAQNQFRFEYYRNFFTTRQWVFPLFMNNNFLGGNELADVRILNHYDGAGDAYDFADQPSNWLPAPFPFVKFIIEKILQDADYSLKGSFFEDAEIQNLLLEGFYSTDYKVKDGNEFVGDHFNFSDLLPEYTCESFLKSLKQTFCLGIFFDNYSGECRIISMEEILTQNGYTDWTEYAQRMTGIKPNSYEGIELGFDFDDSDDYVGTYVRSVAIYNEKAAVQTINQLPSSGNNRSDVRYVLDDNMFCIVDVDIIPDLWSSYAQLILNKTIGNGGEQYTSAMPPAFVRHGPYDAFTVAATKQVMGWVSRQGNSAMFQSNATGQKARLLFWRGEDTDDDSNPYPMASNNVYEWDQTRTWNYALMWDTEWGLINKWWMHFIQFAANTKYVTFLMKPDLRLFFDNNLWEKKRIDRNDYLIKEITFELTQDGLGSIEAQMALVRFNPWQDDLVDFYVPVPPEPE